MMTINRNNLLTLEAYSKIRKSSKPEFIAHRRRRSVALGEHVTLQFEDEQTIRRQIQEMLHIEKIFDEEGISWIWRRIVCSSSNCSVTCSPRRTLRRRRCAIASGLLDLRIFA